MASKIIPCLWCWFMMCGVGVRAPAPAPSPPSQDLPAETGVHYQQNDAQWIKLERPTMADTKAQGMERFLDTYGLSGLNVTVTFRGPQAAVRIADRRPTFYVRGIGPAEDVLIVQLKRKKDTRETETAVSNVGTGNKGGFRRSDIHQVMAIEFTTDRFAITPAADLEPGEYLLVIEYPGAIFDFGISPAEQP